MESQIGAQGLRPYNYRHPSTVADDRDLILGYSQIPIC